MGTEAKKDITQTLAPFGFWESNFIFFFAALFLFYLLLFVNSVLHIEIFCENEIEVLLKGFPFGICLLGLVAIIIKKSGRQIKDYFAIYLPKKWDVCVRLPCVAITVVILIALLRRLFACDSQWTSAVYTYADSQHLVPLLYLRVAVEAPLVEELTFRGFLYKSWSSQLGTIGGTLLISLVFGAIHTQYNLIGMAQCMLLSLALGYLRVRSGSITLPILFHAFWNASILCLSQPS